MTAGANVQAIARPTRREEMKRLADEQAALRRVATLVARGAPSSEVFSAVAREIAAVMRLPSAAVARFDDGGTAVTVLAVCDDHPHRFRPGTRWPLDGPSATAAVYRTARPARFEDYAGVPGAVAAEAREAGLNRTVAAPIIVDGRVWGLVTTTSPDAPFPDHIEQGLAAFTDLVATAIANCEAREDLTRLAEEQAALRRVAVFVAEGAPPPRVFEAVIAEVGRLIPADAAALSRYEADDALRIVGGWSRTDGYVPVGARHPLGQGTLGRLVSDARRPARVESYSTSSGSLARAVREELGWTSSVGAPIVVEGRLWGVIAMASTTDEPLPPGAEARLAQFTELLATAVANAEGREKLTRLAQEQAALRRVATLVAEGGRPAEVFQAVTEEVGRLVAADAAALSRFEGDGMLTTLGGWTRTGAVDFHVGWRFAPEPGTVARLVLDTRRPARISGYGGGLRCGG
jgi:GAF domain-containing protein